MKIHLKDYAFLFLVAGTVLILDQVSKFIVRANLSLGDMWSPWHWLTPYARIVHINNSGAAFGMLQRFGGIFTILAVIVVIAILYYFPRVPRQEWVLRFAMGLQFGGAIGNLTDRLMHGGYVTDFISVLTFPVFNVADASISIGTAILILYIWFRERDNPPSDTSKPVGSASDMSSSSVPEDVSGE